MGALDNIDLILPLPLFKVAFFNSLAMISIRDPIVIEDAPSKKISLPGSYVNVPAVSCKTDQLSVPQLAFSDEAAAAFLLWGQSALSV